MRIIRVFTAKSKATPDDDLAFVGPPPFPLMIPDADEVHISATFSWDKPKAIWLAAQWSPYVRKVRIGGPAFDSPAEDFEPGRYLRTGYVITSRGCPNRCDFCDVPRKEGAIRTIPIRVGWIIADNNLLACPRSHVEAVCDMLSRWPKYRVEFNGGFESRRVSKWFAKRAAQLCPESIFLAYDSSSKATRRNVRRAAELLWTAGISRRKHILKSYVLVGYDGDTMSQAETRLEWIASLGISPFPMYYRPPDAKSRSAPLAWRSFLWHWRRRKISISTKVER